MVATDRNPRAVAMATFNAHLNRRSSVECREGDLFEPVTGETLLSTHLNLAALRINAGTAIASRTAEQLGLTDVRGAVIYGAGVPTTDSSSDATRVLDEINENRSERY